MRRNPYKVFNDSIATRFIVVKVKISILLPALAIIVMLSVTLSSSGATAQNSDDSYDNYWGSDGPIAIIYGENATIGQCVELKEWCYSIFYTDTGNYTLKIKVNGPRDVYNSHMQDPINWQMNYLTSISYKASWQDNKETQVYSNNRDNQTKTFDFELTNIPYGNNTLQIDTSYVVTVYGPPYYALNLSKGTSYFFILAPMPTSTPTSFLTLYNSIIILAVIIGAVSIPVILALVYYKKYHSRVPPL